MLFFQFTHTNSQKHQCELLSDRVVFAAVWRSAALFMLLSKLKFTLPRSSSTSSEGILATSQNKTIVFPSKYFEGFLYLHLTFTLLSLCLFRCTFNVSHFDNRPAKGNVTSLDTFGPQRPVRYAAHSSCFAGYFDGSTQQNIIPIEPLIFLSLVEA